MRGLDILKKKSRPDLVKQAENLKIKVSKYWNRTKLATEIIQKEKLNELEIDSFVDPVNSRGSENVKNPELEAALAKDQPPGPSQEAPQEAPGPAHVDYSAPGSATGRTPGLSDEKARVERILKNQVPDPVYLFFLNKFFNGWQRLAKNVPNINLSKDEEKLIGIPATNLMSYYFPNLHISPVLEMWFGLYMSLELVIGSRFDAIKLSRSGPVIVNKDSEKSIVNIIDKLKDMSPERINQFAGMLGIKETVT